MQTAVTSADANAATTANYGALVGLVSAVAFAAAGTWLGYSLFSRKRTLPVAGQVLLGALAGCAGVMTWTKREEEAEAARHLAHHVHEVRDVRWIRKNPVAYG
jgi:high-affinity Fe2+/Pb2+ permease